MKELSQNIVLLGSVVAALLTLFGLVKSFVKHIEKKKEYYLKLSQRNRRQDRDIARLKEENQLICYGLSAALDGLEQLGANHTVPKAKEKLEKYLNQEAHK